jgi:hypothetical protein
MVFQDQKLANEHSPELRFVTDDIDEIYARISTAYPQLLRPNLVEVIIRRWGAKAFAIADGQLGIRFQQW